MQAAWNAEREDLLRELVPRGHSYSVIAARISALPGPPITRNAALGKAHRLGIAPARKGQSPTTRKQRAARKPQRRLRPPSEAMVLAQMQREAFRAEPDIVVPLEERRQLLDLESGDCRWPIGSPGEPDFTFCNRLQIGTESRLRRGVSRYCELHHARAYNPPQPRRYVAPSASAVVRQKETA